MKGVYGTVSDDDSDQSDEYHCDQPNDDADGYDDAKDNPFRTHHSADQDAQ